MQVCMTTIHGNIKGYCHISGEVVLSKADESYETSTEGKGRGDLPSLRQVWSEILKWAQNQGIKTLYCEPTESDGRGTTREKVYSRVGFKKIAEGFMSLTMEV